MQQRVAGSQATRGCSRRNASAPGGSKLPMFEPRNSASVRPLGARARHRVDQAALVGRLVRRDDEIGVERRQRARGEIERRGRDVDQMHGQAARRRACRG